MKSTNDTNFFGYTGGVFTLLFGSMSGSQVFEIISVILSIISFIVSIAFTLWKWYKKAKADGEITLEEIQQLADEIEKIKEEEKRNGRN